MPCYLGHPGGCHGLVSTPVLVPHHDALVVLDDKLVVLDRLASRVVDVGAAEVEEVVIEDREHICQSRLACPTVARRGRVHSADN